MKIEDSYGRLLTESQMTNDLKEIAQELPTIEKQNGRYQCFRCGSMIDQKLWKLSEEVLYCRACIQLGRIRVIKNFMLLHSMTLKDRRC